MCTEQLSVPPLGFRGLGDRAYFNGNFPLPHEDSGADKLLKPTAELSLTGPASHASI